MRTWLVDSAIASTAVDEILSGREDAIVLVNSLPRTASKYAFGVFAAAWRAGLKLDRPLDKTDSRIANAHVWHAHGISEERIAELQRASDGPGTDSGDKVDRHVVARQAVLSSPRKIIVTVVREQFDRYLSEFILRQRREKFAATSDSEIVRIFLKFSDDRYDYEQRWQNENIFETFQVPYLDEKSVGKWIGFCENNLTYIVISISYIDDFLSEFLYSQVSEDMLAYRSREMNFKYGVTNRNSAGDRDLADMKSRLVGLVTREEFAAHLARACVHVDGRRFGVGDALWLASKRSPDEGLAIVRDVIAVDPGNARAGQLMARFLAERSE